MTRHDAPTPIDGLRARLDALDDALALADARLDPELVTRARGVADGARARLGHGTAHTVAALAGATGSGKSSLCNALAGTDVATTGVRRPTTSETLAVVFGDGAQELLDWLVIPQRRRIAADEPLAGLVLLDLPDHDSTAAAHRAEVDRLVQVVDVFVWVVDPQKYADAALHDDYLQRFAGHAAVTVVVLNQADRLAPAERTACAADLARLLAEDGLRGVRVITASATTGEGVDALRRELAALVAARAAVVRRLDADLDWVAGDLSVAIGDAAPERIDARTEAALVDAATLAAGSEVIEHAVQRAYVHRAAQAVGWPPLRWVRRTRTDPLARLGLGGRRAAGTNTTAVGDTVGLRRTAIAADPVAHGRLGEALRALGREAGRGLTDAPRARVDAVVDAAGARLPDALDAAAARTDLHVAPARWWTPASIAQRCAAAAMAVGMLWLVALFVVAWFRLPDPPLPRVGRVPLPTLLALGGAALGLLVAAVGRRVAAVGARRRARRARDDLALQVRAAVRSVVIEPIDAELAVITRLAQQVRTLAR